MIILFYLPFILLTVITSLLICNLLMLIFKRFFMICSPLLFLFLFIFWMLLLTHGLRICLSPVSHDQFSIWREGEVDTAKIQTIISYLMFRMFSYQQETVTAKQEAVFILYLKLYIFSGTQILISIKSFYKICYQNIYWAEFFINEEHVSKQMKLWKLQLHVAGKLLLNDKCI